MILFDKDGNGVTCDANQVELMLKAGLTKTKVEAKPEVKKETPAKKVEVKKQASAKKEY